MRPRPGAGSWRPPMGPGARRARACPKAVCLSVPGGRCAPARGPLPAGRLRWPPRPVTSGPGDRSVQLPLRPRPPPRGHFRPALTDAGTPPPPGFSPVLLNVTAAWAQSDCLTKIERHTFSSTVCPSLSRERFALTTKATFARHCPGYFKIQVSLARSTPGRAAL